MRSIIWRAAISAGIMGMVTMGNSIQLIMQDGKFPSKTQWWCAGIGAVIVICNDIKSRFTPTES